MIELKNVQAGYDKTIILPDISLTIPKHKITVFIGQNGCGKSTLLKTIARVLPLQKGNIYIDGETMKKVPHKTLSKKMAVLPQNPTAPAYLSVEELVSFGRYPYQKPLSSLTKEDHEIINWAMKKTGVYEWRKQRVEALSGGQRQRVWIAMVLAQKSELLLLDEPTTYLDISYQLEILELLKELNLEHSLTVVMVLHEINHAAKFADHIIGLKKGELLFQGSPMEVITKDNLDNLYDIDTQIIYDETKNYPICFDYTLQSKSYRNAL